MPNSSVIAHALLNETESKLEPAFRWAEPPNPKSYSYPHEKRHRQAGNEYGTRTVHCPRKEVLGRRQVLHKLKRQVNTLGIQGAAPLEQLRLQLKRRHRCELMPYR